MGRALKWQDQFQRLSPSSSRSRRSTYADRVQGAGVHGPGQTMTSQGGAGAFPSAQERPGPQAVPIEPPIIASENPVLLRIRGNRLLDQIGHSDSTHQVLRIARLAGDIAAITSTLTMTLCDIIFKLGSNHSERQVRARHSLTLEAIEIINDICAQPLVLQ